MAAGAQEAGETQTVPNDPGEGMAWLHWPMHKPMGHAVGQIV